MIRYLDPLWTAIKLELAGISITVYDQPPTDASDTDLWLLDVAEAAPDPTQPEKRMEAVVTLQITAPYLGALRVLTLAATAEAALSRKNFSLLDSNQRPAKAVLIWRDFSVIRRDLDQGRIGVFRFTAKVHN